MDSLSNGNVSFHIPFMLNPSNRRKRYNDAKLMINLG